MYGLIMKNMVGDLQIKIQKAIEMNQLENEMSVIRMEAAKQNVTDAELQRMISAEKRNFQVKNKAVTAAKKYKGVLMLICIVVIVIEWLLIFDLNPAEGEKSGFLLTLVTNLFSVLVIVIGTAVYFRKYN